MTAPIASGWSGCRVGLAPTGKRRLSRRTPRSGHRGRTYPNTSLATASLPLVGHRNVCGFDGTGQVVRLLRAWSGWSSRCPTLPLRTRRSSMPSAPISTPRTVRPGRGGSEAPLELFQYGSLVPTLDPAARSITVGLVLDRANDPTSLLSGNWAQRQTGLAAFSTPDALWAHVRRRRRALFHHLEPGRRRGRQRRAQAGREPGLPLLGRRSHDLGRHPPFRRCSARTCR